MALIVRPNGYAHWKNVRLPCAIGRGGISTDKVEGDGVTPCGVYPFREVFYREDRIAAPKTALSCRAISPEDGWCDDPSDARYNQLVTLPIDASHEKLLRDDGLYDLIVVLGFNDDPAMPGHGSAIFLHVAAPGLAPTEGCVALSLDHVVMLVGEIGPNDVIDIRLSEDDGC